MIFLLILQIFYPLAYSFPQYITPGELLQENKNEFKQTFEFWRTSTRLTSNGQTEDFKPGESFYALNALSIYRHGLTPYLQFSGGFNLRSNLSRYEYGDRIINAQSSGVQAYVFEIDYALRKKKKSWNWTLHVGYHLNPYTETPYEEFDTDKIYFGDVGNDLKIGLINYKKFNIDKSFSWGVFYRQPAKNISSEINYFVEVAKSWQPFTLSGGVEGIKSLNNDRYKNNIDDRPVYNTGGTALYHSYHREVIRPYITVHVPFSDYWRFETRLTTVFSGRSTDQGQSITFSLARRNRRRELSAEAMNDKTASAPKFEHKSYADEFEVTEVSKNKKYIKIKLLPESKIAQGMSFRLFKIGIMGKEELLAHAFVTEFNQTQAILKISERYVKKYHIVPGVKVRGLFLENQDLKPKSDF